MIMKRMRLIPVLVAMLGLTLASETKRAPSGFQGVRGKKSISDTYPNANLIPDTEDVAIADMEKRIPTAGFHGMRGKKLYPERNYMSNMLDEMLPKRAPMGFLGMRGKKEMEYVDDELEKRAPMGFLGMRGKKEDDENSGIPDDFYMEKRAPVGFLGMRGKKEYELDESKRAPATGFFGMRGKKQPGWSSFFGMRGKKYPYEFRGKFVGVRGKKQFEENALPEMDEEGNNYDAITNLDLNDLMVLLQDNNNDGIFWEKRKGPSGFLGMRG